MPKEILLDVTDLEPPEPLVLTMEAVEQIQSGEYIRMLHRRDPCLLYSKLEENNLEYRQRKGEHSAVELFIWCKGDEEVETAINTILAE